MNILITGVSSGLGSELTSAFLSRGHNVWGISRKNSDSPALDDLTSNKDFIYSKCDIARENDVLSLIDDIKKKNFDIDVAILNAALMQNDIKDKKFNKLKFKEVFDVNLYGAVSIIDIILPIFQQKGQGIFIGISSLAAYRGIVVDKIAYPASKSALNMVFEAFRLQLDNPEIRFITVNLGPMSNEKGVLTMSYKQAAQKIIALIDKKGSLYNYSYLSSMIIKILKYFPDSFVSQYVIKNKRNNANY